MLARNLISGSVCELNARHRLSDNVRMLIWTSYMCRHVQSVIIIQPNVKWLLSLLSVASNCILGIQDRLYIRRVRGIMRNDFKDYVPTFCQLCTPSKTLDFLHCLSWSAALSLAEWIIASFWPFQVLIHWWNASRNADVKRLILIRHKIQSVNIGNTLSTHKQW